MKIRPINPKGRQAARLRGRKRQLLARVRLPPQGLPGSLALTHRRCGKASCHCARGKGHPVWSLTFMRRGRKRVERNPGSLGGGSAPTGGKGVGSSRKGWARSSPLMPNCSPWGGSSSVEGPLGGSRPAVFATPAVSQLRKGEDVMARQRQPRTPPAPVTPPPPVRPRLAEDVPRLLLLEREVEDEFRPRMLEALQQRVDTLAADGAKEAPNCPHCTQPMPYPDAPHVSWLTRFGPLRARASRYRCPPCQTECRPLLERLGVEPGRISGSLARLLALLGVVVPYEMAAQLAWLFFGVRVNSMTVWRAVQRLGEAAVRYQDGLSAYHTDSRSPGVPTSQAPNVVVLGVDGCQLGMQVRSHRRRR